MDHFHLVVVEDRELGKCPNAGGIETMKTIEIVGICDLNAAVAAKDAGGLGSRHSEICLIAQFATRITGKKVSASTYSAVSFLADPGEYKFHVDGLQILAQLFDVREYEEVRKQLPKLVVVDYQQ